MERRLAARYVLHEEVGVGGTARVYRGVDEHLGRPVAVKVLDTGLAASADPAGRDRFLRECRTAAGFDHPAAVTVYDAGEDGDDLYLVMELVDGETLAQRLARGPLPLSEALHVAQQVLAVLAIAHARGIVHRDVKPANVLLGAEGVVKLSDFGIAKRFDDLESSVTSTGMIIGTPRYLAPEQATGAPVTPAADVYAVGVLLYEMIAGHPPFAGESAIAIAVAQQTAPAPDIRAECPDVPVAVAGMIAAALSADPTARPASADEFAHALSNGPSVTAEMPAVAVPTPMERADLTTAMAVPVMPGPAFATVRSDRVAGHVPVARHRAHPAHEPSRSPAMLVGVGVLVLLLLASGLALAFGDRSEPGLLAADGSDPGSGAVPTSAAAETPAPTIPLDDPDPTAPAPVVIDELVPGFPSTDDLLVFLNQLETNPDTVGDGGAELGRELRRALEGNERRRGERVGKLREWLPQFVEDGHVHPAVASALDELLAPLDAPRDDDDDDDDD